MKEDELKMILALSVDKTIVVSADAEKATV